VPRAAFVLPLVDSSGRFAGLGDAVTGAVQWFEGRPDQALAPRLQAEILAAHERVVEAAADVDESILVDALAGRRVAAPRLQAALRAEFWPAGSCPCSVAPRSGIEASTGCSTPVVALMPSLSELPRLGLWSADRAGDADAPFCGFVFKVHHGDEIWNFVRVVRGRLPTRRALVPRQAFLPRWGHRRVVARTGGIGTP
jgi:hypothetical protein